MSLPHGDVLCDSLRKRCTAKWNLFLLRSKGQNNMHTNVRLWIKATCGPSAKLTDLLMSNRVSSMMLMVKLESWGYSHKSRNAWASCFWLTRTPVRCIFSFHAPSSTWWECVTVKCNYVKTSNDELMFTPYSVSQIPMQCSVDVCVEQPNICRVCSVNVNFFTMKTLQLKHLKFGNIPILYSIHVQVG